MASMAKALLFTRCTQNTFRDKFEEIFNKENIRYICIVVNSHYPSNFNFYVKYHTDEITDIEKELPKYTDYSQDINNILYEPTNTTMSLFEIIEKPFILGVHIFNLSYVPKFKIIFGKMNNLYYIPMLGTFVKDIQIKKSKFVFKFSKFALGMKTQYLILWDYIAIEQNYK
ncbi:hypothetical protein AGMMS49579_01090 [Spirochaetia bacterium]|nr:hypothetical protein AGMMS49579_01090 [Spirochaetia bacterium]